MSKYANRGRVLEDIIEHSNIIYKHKGYALIDKIPTPWTVIRGKGGKINKAFPHAKSTVDFIGLSNGTSIAFDAKSTNEKNLFPLSNIHEHQIEYLRNHDEQAGVSFLLVHFSKYQETYYLKLDDLNDWWDGQFKGGRKSIPYSWFKGKCDRIVSGNGVPLDYLYNVAKDLRKVRGIKKSKNTRNN